MMGKYPKFMIAKNPMAEPDGVYIFHSQKPRFLAKVEGGAIEVVDDIDTMTDYYKGDVHKVDGLFKAMFKWYKSYYIHEKENS